MEVKRKRTKVGVKYEKEGRIRSEREVLEQSRKSEGGEKNEKGKNTTEGRRKDTTLVSSLP